MAARDFINETLLPWLEEEIASDAKGNKHYVRGVEDTMDAVTRFIEAHRTTCGRTRMMGLPYELNPKHFFRHVR